MTVLSEVPSELRQREQPARHGAMHSRSGGRFRSLAAGWRRRLWCEGGVVVLLCIAVYFAIALVLDFKTLSFSDDAVSRMANGFYVLYSRDPHLAAIGFVWNPLQSICDIVPLLFKDLWPALASHDVAGSIVSVLCMAGAVHQVHSALREWELARIPRLVITTLFAVNPMILLYSANGMSEALYLFTLIATCRYISRWVRNDDLRSLIYAAVALGLCYLARNEAVAAAALAGALVTIMSYYRADGARNTKIMRGLTDAVIFLMPVATTFAGWAVASYVITGQPFAQFTSQYGTAAQIAASGGSDKQLGLVRAVYLEAHAVEYLAPLLPLILLIALFCAWKRRDSRIFAPVSVVGAGLMFDLAAYLAGSITWSFRYFIATIPMEMLLVGFMLAPPLNKAKAGHRVRGSLRARSRQGPASERRKRWLVSVAGSGVSLALLAPAIPATAAGMFNPTVGVLELSQLGYVFHRPLTKQDRVNQQHFASILKISNYLTSLNLPDGDILVDNFTECIPQLLTTVPNPKVFVIPNDRDFQRILADPLTFGTHYILLPPTTGLWVDTATAKAYPTLYATGAGFAKEVKQVPTGSSCPSMRLYRVTGHPNAVGQQPDTATATNQGQ